MPSLALIAASGILLRALLIYHPQAQSLLQSRPELSTPLTSWRHLQEGIFVHRRGSDAYDGGVFFHSPFHLYLFSAVPPLFSPLLFILADCISTWALLNLWTCRRGSSSRRLTVAAAYMLNPYAIATCIAKSTTAIDNALVLGAISAAARDSPIVACGLLAVATHCTLYPMTLLVPILRSISRPKVGASAYLLALSGLSIFFIRQLGRNWATNAWGTIFSVTDLTPNVGMWWYFFTEMFDHFRPFFLGVFQLHNAIYLAPLCLRFSDSAQVSILVLLGISSTWKSYPQLGDHAAWIGLLSCFPEITSDLRHPLFTTSVHLYTAILLPLLHSLWLLTGAGNANFFYAATMVYGLNASLAVVDVLGAALKLPFKTVALPNREVVQLATL